MRRSSLAPTAACLLAVSLLGCSNEVTDPKPYTDLTTPFILTHVNGTQLPYIETTARFENGAAVNDSTIITGAAIMFEADETLRFQVTMRRKRYQGTQVLSNVTTTSIYTGPWSLDGNKVTMSYVVDGVTHSTMATVDGSGLTFDHKETYYTSATQTATVTRAFKFGR